MVNKNGNRKWTAEKVVAVNFLFLLFFQYMNKGKRKMKNRKGKVEDIFRFYFRFQEKKKKTETFPFPFFVFHLFPCSWKRIALHWKWIPKHQNRKTHLPFCVFHRAKMGKWTKRNITMDNGFRFCFPFNCKTFSVFLSVFSLFSSLPVGAVFRHCFVQHVVRRSSKMSPGWIFASNRLVGYGRTCIN